MSGYTVLRHSQHEGYYSPNNTANKATPYIFDTVVKSSDGKQIGMKFKGTGDREWVIIYVPSTDFTPTYNNVIKLINDNKDVSNRKVVIRENEKAKAARIVTNFFNSPSIAGNEKMTTSVKKPQYLKHSEDLDIIDVSEDCLEHHGVKGMKWGVINEDEKKGGRKSAEQSSSNSTRSSSNSTSSSRNSSGGHSYYSPNTGNSSQYNLNVKRNVNPGRNASGSSKEKGTVWDFSHNPLCYSTGIEMPVKNIRTNEGVIFDISGTALKRVLDNNGDVAALARNSVINRLKEFQDRGIDIYLTDKQIDMIVWRLVYAVHNNWKKYHYNVQHSLFTEVYDMDEYLEHHGILGMKWGVRRYQNADGSLTKEGREHYKIEGARFKERYKDNYELALKTANDARKVAIEKAKEGKNGAGYLNKAFHQQNLADRYAKKLDKKSQGLMSFEKNKEAEKLGKEIYEYYKDKPMGKFVAQSVGLSAVATAASFGLSAALGLPLFFLYSVEANRYELKDDDDKK